MITQISPSPKFHSRKIYVERITVYFLAIFANFSYKIEKFELEVSSVDILGTKFCFQSIHYHIL